MRASAELQEADCESDCSFDGPPTKEITHDVNSGGFLPPWKKLLIMLHLCSSNSWLIEKVPRVRRVSGSLCPY